MTALATPRLALLWALLGAGLGLAGSARAQSAPVPPTAPAPAAAPAAPVPPAAPAREGRFYAPGDFERLEVAGSAQVRLMQGERDQVFIAGGPEVQKSIDVELQRDHRLVIRPAGGWKFWSSSRLQVDVLMRQLSQLVISGNSDVHVVGPLTAERLSVHISGAGLARFDELNADQLRFSVSGAGDGQLRGQVKELTLQVSGKGKLMAEQLRAARATVSISGIGNAGLWVSDELRVNVSGIGTVEYWGSPEVRRSSSGIASVKALGEKREPAR